MSNTFSPFIPQNVRGHTYRAWLGTQSYDFVDVVNVTGHGKIYMIAIQLEVPTDYINFKLNIDGAEWPVAEFSGDTDPHPLVLYPLPSVDTPNIRPINATDVRSKLLNLEFDTSLLVQIHRLAGTGIVYCEVYYSLDPF